MKLYLIEYDYNLRKCYVAANTIEEAIEKFKIKKHTDIETIAVIWGDLICS